MYVFFPILARPAWKMETRAQLVIKNLTEYVSGPEKSGSSERDPTPSGNVGGIASLTRPGNLTVSTENGSTSTDMSAEINKPA